MNTAVSASAARRKIGTTVATTTVELLDLDVEVDVVPVEVDVVPVGSRD